MSSDGCSVIGPDLEPAACAVDRLSGDEHEREQRQADAEEDAGDALQRPVVDTHEHDEEDEADDREQPLPLQVVGGVALGDRGPRRAGAVHHDEAERDEPERDEHEQPVHDRHLEPSAGPRCSPGPLHRGSSSRERLDELAEALAPLLEVPELVEARAGRRQQDDLARPRVRGRPGDCVLQVAAALERHRLVSRASASSPAVSPMR